MIGGGVLSVDSADGREGSRSGELSRLPATFVRRVRSSSIFSSRRKAASLLRNAH